MMIARSERNVRFEVLIRRRLFGGRQSRALGQLTPCRFRHREFEWAEMSARYGKRSKNAEEIDVSRYGPSPWRQLSPYVKTPEQIPVPGLASYLDFEDPSMFPEWWSSTTEGVWQGLKVIDGRTAPEQFGAQPKKRRGRPDGHLYGDYRLLGYLEAKALVYIPAYLSQLRQHEDLLQDLRKRASPDCLIVDVSYSPEVLGAKPISHAALLVDYLNGKLEPYETAHQRLQGWAARINDWYRDAPESVEPEPFLHELADETAALQNQLTRTSDLEIYEASAMLFERENLLLLLARSIGSWYQLEIACQLFTRLLESELLTREEAEKLAERSPVSRWGDGWLRLG